MKVGELLRLLREDGWFLVATRGSHRQFRQADGAPIPQPVSKVAYVEVAA
jgi:predicted RNA binding protein YcfA (HicA-like mRNA interferase family)